MGRARDYMPALAYGHKIYPYDLAGSAGLPHVGNIYYVDPSSGSDSAGGKSHEDAFATVATAHAAMTADQDDVLIVAATSSTGRTSETAAVTWSKRRTHMVGNGPARKINPRNGLGFAASLSPCFTVSATNCSFTNLSFASFTDNDILVDVTASYASFNNVHFQGIGTSTSGASATARSLRLTAAGECEFNHCTIGIDTVTRSAANASLELTGSCPRNKFYDCDFPIYTSSADALFVKADTGNCTERFLRFDECIFNNATLGSSTTMTIAMDLSATGNGTVILKDSYQIGCTDWTNTFTNIYSAGIATVPTAATAGFMQVLA